jgi:hypothetical protein
MTLDELIAPGRKMHQDIHDTTEQELYRALAVADYWELHANLWQDACEKVKKERDQLLELVTFYERELIRERGYI